VKPDSLQRLHDFYQPPAPSWMPRTIGWYLLFALLLVLIAWAAWRIVLAWRKNAYRRGAVRELDHLELSRLPALLKRAALAAWPRSKVASLSCESWITFLQTGDAPSAITEEVGRQLIELDYKSAKLTREEEARLRRAARHWIRSHRVRV
jgi:hypothetical protein